MAKECTRHYPKHILTHSISPSSRLGPLPAQLTLQSPREARLRLPVWDFVSSLPPLFPLRPHHSQILTLGAAPQGPPPNTFFTSFSHLQELDTMLCLYLFAVRPLPLEYGLHEGRDLTYFIPCARSCLERCLARGRHPEDILLNK